MARAEYTYEVRKLPTDPVWIEDYVVRTSDGESVGTVGGVLERRGERLLIVERGVVPVVQDRRVVPWRGVDRIDHDAVAVWLTLTEPQFLEEALELDPGLAVEEGEAEAKRLREIPDEAQPAPQAQPGGPVDRSASVATLALAGAAAFTVLVAAIVLTASENLWTAFLFVVPAVLAVVALVVGYRAYRSPYEPRGAFKP